MSMACYVLKIIYFRVQFVTLRTNFLMINERTGVMITHGAFLFDIQLNQEGGSMTAQEKSDELKRELNRLHAKRLSLSNQMAVRGE